MSSKLNHEGKKRLPGDPFDDEQADHQRHPSAQLAPQGGGKNKVVNEGREGQVGKEEGGYRATHSKRLSDMPPGGLSVPRCRAYLPPWAQ